MRRFLLWGCCVCLGAASLHAQHTNTVLQQIEHNNKALQALRKQNEAAATDARAANRPEALSVEYSPFFARGAHGLASSELVVSQAFDFPTRYAARRKQNHLEAQALDMQYAAQRQAVLLQAKLLCFDLVRANRQRALLHERQQNADALLKLFEKKLQLGNATQIEVNQIKMNRMSVLTEAHQNEANRQSLGQQLISLGAEAPLVLTDTLYPPTTRPTDSVSLQKRLAAADPAVRTSQAALAVSEQGVKMARQSWLPSLEVGYRRNTDAGTAVHGLMVGASLPLFAHRDQQKSARLKREEAQLQLEYAQRQADSRIRQQYLQLRQLQSNLAAYDVALLRSTLRLLGRAVAQGSISLTDYYTEADKIYQSLQARDDWENQYQKQLAELFQSDL